MSEVGRAPVWQVQFSCSWNALRLSRARGTPAGGRNKEVSVARGSERRCKFLVGKARVVAKDVQA